MKTIVNSSRMRDADAYTIEMLNSNGIILMEHAGSACVRELKKDFGECLREKRVLCVAGKGNNGGDAVVVARQLVSMGVKVKLVLLAKPEDYSGDAAFQIAIVKNYPVEMEVIDKERKDGVDVFKNFLKETDIVVDGIFGTGLSKPVKGFYGEIINSINRDFNGFVLSVDIPSGLFADKSHTESLHVVADKTITFGKLKPCHILFPACKSCGKVIEDWITIPDFVFEKIGDYFKFVEKEDIPFLKKYFPENSHKGTFGHVGIFAGEKGKLGASILASYASLKSGCGLSTVFLEKDDYSYVSSFYPEIMFYLAENVNKNSVSAFSKGKNSVLIGQGLGVSEKSKDFAKKVVETCEVPAVLDADIFRNFKIDELSSLLKGKKAVLTPHPGEMSFLTGYSKEKIAENRIEIAKEVSEKTGAVVVLKGYQTVIAYKEDVFVNGTGSNALGTAGSGDVLGGVIASLLSQGYSLIDAAVLAVCAHGLAGDIAECEKGREGVVAGDIIANISKALNYE